MISVLIIKNSKTKDETLESTLENFQGMKITLAHSFKEAFALSKMNYFALAFIDAKIDGLNSGAIEALRAKNTEIMILIYNLSTQAPESGSLMHGVKDYLGEDISKELLNQRIENYLEIAHYKKERLFNTKAVNLFNKNIYQRKVVFNLDSHLARVEFWDYFMNEHFFEYEKMEDSIGVMYAFSSWLFSKNHECEITKETSLNTLYLTLYPIEHIPDKVIEDILQKYDHNVVHIIKDNKLSLQLLQKTVMPEEKQPEAQKKPMQPEVKTSKEDAENLKKEILSKTHFKKITAADFIDMTAVSYLDKIDILADMEQDAESKVILFEQEPRDDILTGLVSDMLEYVAVVKLLVEFDHLAFALETLANSINALKLDDFEEKKLKKFSTLMLHLINDLSSWRENIFIKQEANDIHYLDSSLLSSCLQIEAIFQEQPEEEDDDDFELF